MFHSSIVHHHVFPGTKKFIGTERNLGLKTDHLKFAKPSCRMFQLQNFRKSTDSTHCIKSCNNLAPIEHYYCFFFTKTNTIITKMFHKA